MLLIKKLARIVYLKIIYNIIKTLFKKYNREKSH